MTREAAPHKLMQKCIKPFSCQKDVSTFHLSARPRTKASRGNAVRTRNEKATFLPPHSLHLSGSCCCSLQSALITSFPSPTLLTVRSVGCKKNEMRTTQLPARRHRMDGVARRCTRCPWECFPFVLDEILLDVGEGQLFDSDAVWRGGCAKLVLSGVDEW